MRFPGNGKPRPIFEKLDHRVLNVITRVGRLTQKSPKPPSNLFLDPRKVAFDKALQGFPISLVPPIEKLSRLGFRFSHMVYLPDLRPELNRSHRLDTPNRVWLQIILLLT